MLAPLIRKRINPWVDWLEHSPMHHKLVEAFLLLDQGRKGYVTIEDLEMRAHAPAFAKHRAKVKHFYEEAVKRNVGSLNHRDWLREELPKLTPQQLADVIAFLPEQSTHTPKPRLLGLVPDTLMDSVTAELNAKLVAMGAPTMALDVLPRLLEAMGTAVVRER